MSELSIELNWQRQEPELLVGKYTNVHSVHYSKDCQVQVDAAPDWGGDAAHTNPEQALAAALSSCHMMTFLALAAKVNWPVCGFRDHAVAHLGKNPKGRMSVTQIDLHPVVSFDAGFEIEAGELEKMHHRAHRYCFVANSLADSVKINISQAEDTAAATIG